MKKRILSMFLAVVMVVCNAVLTGDRGRSPLQAVAEEALEPPRETRTFTCDSCDFEKDCDFDCTIPDCYICVHFCPGDVNGDGVISIHDMRLALAASISFLNLIVLPVDCPRGVGNNSYHAANFDDTVPLTKEAQQRRMFDGGMQIMRLFRGSELLPDNSPLLSNTLPVIMGYNVPRKQVFAEICRKDSVIRYSTAEPIQADGEFVLEFIATVQEEVELLEDFFEDFRFVRGGVPPRGLTPFWRQTSPTEVEFFFYVEQIRENIPANTLFLTQEFDSTLPDFTLTGDDLASVSRCSLDCCCYCLTCEPSDTPRLDDALEILRNIIGIEKSLCRGYTINDALAILRGIIGLDVS